MRNYCQIFTTVSSFFNAYQVRMANSSWYRLAQVPESLSQPGMAEVRISNSGSKEDTQKILSESIVSGWKIWNMSWQLRNEDTEDSSRYSTQLQDYTNATNINIIYESYTIMGWRLDARLMKVAQTHLKEERVNIINWLILHRETMKAETDTYDSNLWGQIQ